MEPPPFPLPPPLPAHPSVLSYRRAEAFATAPDNCYRCGYPLLGIDDERPCPECGLLARRSRRRTDELHNTRPRWLNRISRGAVLILYAVLVAIAWPFVWREAVVPLYFSAGRFGSPLWTALPWAGVILGALMLAVGAWMLTGKEGYPPADHADRRLRLMLRLTSCVPLVIVGLLILRDALMPWIWVRVGLIGWRSLLDYAVWALATVGCAPLPVLLFLHLRGLAKRARSAHLAEHCLIVGIGTSAALLFLGAYTVLAANAEAWGLGGHWTSRSNVALAMTLALAVSAILFAMWSLYLFVRFVISFRRAARELRGRWTADDRSLAPAVRTSAAG